MNTNNNKKIHHFRTGRKTVLEKISPPDVPEQHAQYAAYVKQSKQEIVFQTKEKKTIRTFGFNSNIIESPEDHDIVQIFIQDPAIVDEPQWRKFYGFCGAHSHRNGKEIEEEKAQ